MKVIKIIISLFYFSFILGSCDVLDNDPDISIWADEDLNDFVIYAFGPDGDSFAVIDLLTGEIYQQMNGFNGIQSLASNKGGTLIFVSTYTQSTNTGNIYKINTATWDYEIIYEKAAYLLDNRNGGIFFITRQTGSSERRFGNINPDTGEVTEIANISVSWEGIRDDKQIEIHPFKPLLYAIDGNKRFYRFDYTTSTTNYMFEELPFITDFTISAYGEKLYRIGSVLDLNKEEIIGTFSVPLSTGFGSIFPRRDNKEAYITDPGAGPFGQPPYSRKKVFVYSLEENSITDSIDVGNITDRIYLTPQNRYAIVNDRSFSYFIIDLKERKVIKKQQYIENGVRTLSVEDFYLATKPPSLK